MVTTAETLRGGVSMKETTVYISYVDKNTLVLVNVIDIYTGEKFVIFTRKNGDKHIVNMDQLVCFSIDAWHKPYGSDDETDN